MINGAAGTMTSVDAERQVKLRERILAGARASGTDLCFADHGPRFVAHRYPSIDCIDASVRRESLSHNGNKKTP